jgi:hypothetical protein
MLAMHIMDVLAFLLCTTIVAIGVVGELRDVALCKLAVARAAASPPAKIWSRALVALSYLRRRVFLPSLVGNIGFLIIFKGSNALSVCFNSVRLFPCFSFLSFSYHFEMRDCTHRR